MARPLCKKCGYLEDGECMLTHDARDKQDVCIFKKATDSSEINRSKPSKSLNAKRKAGRKRKEQK